MLFWAATALVFSFNAAVLAYAMHVLVSAATVARILSSMFAVIAATLLLGATYFASVSLVLPLRAVGLPNSLTALLGF
jgi:hypothetical protein